MKQFNPSTPDGVSLGGLTKSPPVTYLRKKWNLNKNVCIDWFTFTFPSSDHVYKPIVGSLKLRPNFESNESYGGMMYSKRIQLDEGTSLWLDGPKNVEGLKTAKLEITGMGCRQFEARGGSWKELFETCLSVGGSTSRCTRIDTVIDDFEGELKHDDLYHKIYNREYTSKTFGRRFEIEFHKDSLVQWSLYIGSRFGSAFLNIYDKKLEQIANNKDVWVEDWMRYEMRWHHEKAHSVMLQIIGRFHELNVVIPELLSGFVEFKEQSNYDKNNRYKSDPWEPWVKFLDGVGKTIIRNQREIEQTISKKKDWFERSVSKVLTMLYLSNPTKFASYVGSVVYNKMKDLESEDLSLINNYLSSKGKDLLDPNLISKLKNDLSDMITQGLTTDLLEEEVIVIDPDTGEVLSENVEDCI